VTPADRVWSPCHSQRPLTSNLNVVLSAPFQRGAYAQFSTWEVEEGPVLGFVQHKLVWRRCQ
jgi:hypothetical protein